MKKILVTALAGLMLSACNDNKAREKTLLDEVIKTHDKLMADDGTVMKNKMQLKNIAKSDASANVKDSVAIYTKQLGDADDAMMGWMNKFNPVFTGKSHDEIMAYLNSQKVQILKLDSQINSAVNASNHYIKTKTK